MTPVNAERPVRPAWLEEVHQCLQAGQPLHAKKLLESSLSVFGSTDARVHIWYVRVLRRLKNWELADKHIQEAIRLFSSDVSLQIEAALIAADQQKGELAVERLLQIKERFPQSKAVYERLIRVLVKERRFSDAEDLLRQMQIQFGDGDLYSELAELIKIEEAVLVQVYIKIIGEPDSRFFLHDKKVQKRVVELEKLSFQIYSSELFPAESFVVRRRGGKISSVDCSIERDRENGYVYKFILNNVQDSDSIGVRQGDAIKWLCMLAISRVQQIIEGRDGWLFLANDSNSSVDQFLGRLLLDKEKLACWDDYFATLSSLSSDIPYIFLLAPSKESVKPEFYPHQRGSMTIREQIFSLKSFGQIRSCFPLDALREDGAYYKTDTHWSDFGAYIAAQKCLKELGLGEFSKVELCFEKVKATGDLGEKARPKRQSEMLALSKDLKEPVERVFYNFVSNSGSLSVFENNNSSTDKKLVLFGDSFSGNLNYIFGQIFRRMVRVYSPASPILEIVEWERPDVVIVQTNERFLTMPPLVINTMEESSIARKLVSLSPSEREYVRLALGNKTGESEFRYRDAMMKYLE
ncbi:alginate O-acetyltransferase AlgX-related protein [Bordetella sp. 2513F-2]